MVHQRILKDSTPYYILAKECCEISMAWEVRCEFPATKGVSHSHAYPNDHISRKEFCSTY